MNEQHPFRKIQTANEIGLESIAGLVRFWGITVAPIEEPERRRPSEPSGSFFDLLNKKRGFKRR